MQDLLASGRPRLGESTELSGFLLHGMLIMDRGYIFTCMIVAAIAAFLIDRRFYAAAGWATAAAVLTALGLMHSYQLSGNVLDYWLAFTTPAAGAFVYRGWPLVAGYLLMAAAFVVVGRRQGPEAAALPGDTLHSARLVSENDLAAGE